MMQLENDTNTAPELPIMPATTGSLADKSIPTLYVLYDTDGLLVRCQDRHGQPVNIPFSTLVSHLAKSVARELRSKGSVPFGTERS